MNKSIILLAVISLSILAGTNYAWAEPSTDGTAESSQPLAETGPNADSKVKNEKEPKWKEQEVLFSSGIESGGYGGPNIRIGSVNGGLGILMGGRGGWLINHSLLIGGGGYGLVNGVNARIPGEPGKRLTLGYGGLVLEYLILPAKAVHGSVGVLLGGGGVSVRERGKMPAEADSDRVWVYEPEVGIEFNMTEFFRINLGVGYRFVTGVSNLAPAFENKDFRGVNGSLMLKFGQF